MFTIIGDPDRSAFLVDHAGGSVQPKYTENSTNKSIKENCPFLLVTGMSLEVPVNPNPLALRLLMNNGREKESENGGSSDLTILNVKELEAFLKIDQKTIYRYVSLGLIPYVRIQSNIRFIKRQIITWVEEQNYEPGPPRDRRNH